MVGWAQRAYRLSERRACGTLGAARSSVRYVATRPPQMALRRRIREIAEVRVSYGYRRITVLLRREGWQVNPKRIHRLYREDGLNLRRKRPRRRRSAVPRQARPPATRPNERWHINFMHDALANGNTLRVLTVGDAYTCECVALDAQPRFRGTEVAAVLTRMAATRGLPATINVDNGTEFTSRAFDHWAYANGVQLDFSRPGKPTDNAMIESFNAADYNNHRPHSSLRDMTPAEFAAGHTDNIDPIEDSKRVA